MVFPLLQRMFIGPPPTQPRKCVINLSAMLVNVGQCWAMLVDGLQVALRRSGRPMGIPLLWIAFRCTVVDCIALHCISILPCIKSMYISSILLHCIALQVCNCTSLVRALLSHIALHQMYTFVMCCIALENVALHNALQVHGHWPSLFGAFQHCLALHYKYVQPSLFLCWHC